MNPNLVVDRLGEDNAAVPVRLAMVNQRFHYLLGAVVDFVAQLLVAFGNVGTQLLDHIRYSCDFGEQASQAEYDLAAENGQRNNSA